jgi:hypothetical protein
MISTAPTRAIHRMGRRLPAAAPPLSALVILVLATG